MPSKTYTKSYNLLNNFLHFFAENYVEFDTEAL